MSVRSRDAPCAPNPLQVHAHTALQGTLFWVWHAHDTGTNSRLMGRRGVAHWWGITCAPRLRLRVAATEGGS